MASVRTVIRAWWRPVLGASWLLAVVSLTLQPGDIRIHELGGLAAPCLFCGARGASDAILNVVMFAPLGLVLGGRPRATLTALGLGFVLSTGIELGQMMTPGRDPSPGDVVWNSLGAGVGALVHAWLSAHVRGLARIGAIPWTVLLFLTVPVLGVLATPSPTDDIYWGQWVPNFRSMPRYGGDVLEATLNGRPFPTFRFSEPAPHRTVVEGDWVVSGTVVVGPAPRSVSPVLTVYDGRQREILLLGVQNTDLVFRTRRLADDLLLEAPDVRLGAALEGRAPGDTTTLGARRDDGTLCLSLAGSERCGLGITPGRTWGYLLYLEGPPEWFRRLVDAVWLGVLFFPLGLFARSRREVAAGTAAVLAALFATVALTPLVPGAPAVLVLDLGAAIFGATAGWISLALLRWVSDEAQASADSISANV